MLIAQGHTFTINEIPYGDTGFYSGQTNYNIKVHTLTKDEEIGF